MKQPTKRIIRVAALALLTVGLVAVARSQWVRESTCAALRSRLPQLLGGSATIESCAIDFTTLSVVATNVTFQRQGEITFRSQQVRASPGILGLSRLGLGTLRAVRPEATLILPPTSSARQKSALGKDVCPLDELRNLLVRNLGIEDGKLTVVDGASSIVADGVQLSASSGWRRSSARLEVGSARLRLSSKPEIDITSLKADITVDSNGRSVEVRSASADVSGVRFSSRGVIDSLCGSDSPRLDLTARVYAPLKSLAQLGIPLPNPSGHVVGMMEISGTLAQPAVHAAIESAALVIGRAAPGTFSANFLLNRQELVVDDFTTRSGSGELRLSGVLKLTPPYGFTSLVSTRAASFADLYVRSGGFAGPWVEFPVTLTARVWGTFAAGLDVLGSVEFSTGRFALTNHAYNLRRSGKTDLIVGFESSHGWFQFEADPKGVTFADADIQIGEATQGRVSARLNFDPARFFDIGGTLDPLDLADLTPLAGIPLTGTGAAQFTIEGPSKAAQIDAQLALSSFRFDKFLLGKLRGTWHYDASTSELSTPSLAGLLGESAYTAKARFLFNHHGVDAHAAAAMPAGRLEDLVALLEERSALFAALGDGAVTGSASALANFDGPVNALSGAVALKVQGTQLLKRRLGQGSADLFFDQGKRLLLKPTTLVGPLGTTTAQGEIRFDDAVSGTAGIGNGSLAELIDPSGALPVDGTFTWNATLSGSDSAPKIDGTLASPEVQIRNRSVGAAHIEGAYADDAMLVSGSLFDGVTGAMHLNLLDNWATVLRLDLDIPELRPFVPDSLGQLGGTIAGTLSAEGPLRTPKQVTATLALRSATLTRNDLTLTSAGPITASYNLGVFRLLPAILQGDTNEIAAEGTLAESALDFKARGVLDLRLLTDIFSVFERPSGTLEFTANFSGSPKAPLLSGNAQIQNGSFLNRAYDLKVRDLAAQADFSNSRILLRSAEATFNEGRIVGQGDARLGGAATFQVDLDQVTFTAFQKTPAVTSGSLTLHSDDWKVWQVGGAVDIAKFVFTRTISLDSLLASAKRGTFSEEQPEVRAKFDVDLSLDGDVRLDNNLARARLLGKLRVSGTNVEPILVGTIETGEGAQGFFRSNAYTVTRGLMQFNGLWPTIDLSAYTQLRDYTVFVKAFGRLSDPKVTFSSEPGLSESDVLSLITIGVTSRDRLSGQGGAGVAATALFSASGLDTQVQRFLRQNIGLKDQQLYFTTSFNELTGGIDPAVAWEARLASDNFKVGLLQPITGRGTKAQAEYFFNHRISTRIQWDNQTVNTTYGNPGVELRLRYEWE